MAESFRPLRSDDFTDQQQAAFFYSRERRKSLAGIPKLHRTHLLMGDGVMGLDFASGDIFGPTRQAPVTLRTAIRVTAAAGVAGNLFEAAIATEGTSIEFGSQTFIIRSGADGATNLVATFDNGAAWPDGIELDIVVAIHPGLGRAVAWFNGRQVVVGDSSAPFGVNGWVGGNAGSFALDANAGSRTASSAAAPTNFEVIEPLSVYAKQIPRQFPTPIT